MILCTGKNLHTHTGKALKVPIDPNRLRAIQFVFIMEVISAFADFVLSFVAYVRPKVSRWMPSFPFFHHVNMAVGSLKHYSLPIDSSCGTVRDRDNWRRLSGGISCWNRLWSVCAPMFGCNICGSAEGNNQPQHSYVPRES